ncbi:hypothetical protein J6590_057166 [Homalodisca vitripennis]|nr:hypothetical protein J6590_057166 [Homalodisca vitripennis]
MVRSISDRNFPDFRSRPRSLSFSDRDKLADAHADVAKGPPITMVPALILSVRDFVCVESRQYSSLILIRFRVRLDYTSLNN